jgi:tetratricopeptide (TPR) repeat protein
MRRANTNRLGSTPAAAASARKLLTEEFIAKAVKLNQGSDVSFYNYGIILKALDRPQAALEQFSNAIGLNSKVAESWNKRGTIYNDLKPSAGSPNSARSMTPSEIRRLWSSCGMKLCGRRTIFSA